MRRHREGPPKSFPLSHTSKQNFLFYAIHKLESRVSIKQVEAAQKTTWSFYAHPYQSPGKAGRRPPA